MRLDVAVHPDWDFALFTEPSSSFTVGSGTITNSTELDTGGMPGYLLHSMAVRVSDCSAGAKPCQMFVRLDEAVVADAQGAAVALGVWSASLRFWLWPQAEALRPPVAARAGSVAYARDGRWQIDVMSFVFGDEVFVVGGGVQQSVLETEVRPSSSPGAPYSCLRRLHMLTTVVIPYPKDPVL